MKKKGRVFVLGEDTNAFLSTIRSLGRCGLEVHVGWCPFGAAALKSRYLNQAHWIPAYDNDKDDWVHALRSIFQARHFDLVLPLTDNTILPFQLRRADFEPFVRVCLLPDDVYRICADKGKTYELAIREDVPVPRQRIIRDIQDALKCAEAFGYPLVLKPKQSAVAEDVSKRQAVRKACNERELLELVKMKSGQEILVQQNFIGKGIGVEVLCKDGEIFTAFQHERVHEPMMGGGSSYRKSVPLHDGMYAATSRLMKALQYTGVAMVEYKQNPATGEWLLIEINARFWGSLPLSIAAGLDFPRYLYEMLIEGRANFPKTYRTGIFCRNWTKDLNWFRANLRSNRKDPSLQSVPLWSVLLECGNVLSMRERSDTAAFDDPAPGWADVRQYINEKCFVVLKSSQFYRRFQRARLLRLYRQANRVLVMCHGNICRSPFAAALLGRLAKNKFVMSAGDYPRTGRKPPEEALRAAMALGLDLSSHRSRSLAPGDLESFDAILIFDRRNWQAIRSLCPKALSKVAYLGAADPSRPIQIADPFGRGLDQFEDCYRHISHSIKRLI